MLAVKPQDIETLLGEIGHLLTAEQTVLSVAAAIPTARIERHLGDDVPVVRSMPNTPVDRPRGHRRHVRRARTPAASTSTAPAPCCARSATWSRCPRSRWTRSPPSPAPGPAYYALLAEAMIEAGILLGLSREISTKLVVQTMLGTAKLLRDEHIHPVELREMVTSPGGTTIRAIRELEQAGVRAAFLNAINAAMERSKELARGDD